MKRPNFYAPLIVRVLDPAFSGVLVVTIVSKKTTTTTTQAMVATTFRILPSPPPTGLVEFRVTLLVSNYLPTCSASFGNCQGMSTERSHGDRSCVSPQNLCSPPTVFHSTTGFTPLHDSFHVQLAIFAHISYSSDAIANPERS